MKGVLPLSYMQSLIRILALDQTIHRELEETGRLFKVAFVNILLLGLTAGAANAVNALTLIRQEQAGGFENPNLGAIIIILLIFASTAQIFLAHAGFSLLLWAMSKGLKGVSSFFTVYMHTGAALAPLWLGVPMLLFYFNGVGGIFTLLLGAIGVTWGVITLTRSVMVSQHLTFARAAFALAITVIFIISFRILTT